MVSIKNVALSCLGVAAIAMVAPSTVSAAPNENYAVGDAYNTTRQAPQTEPAVAGESEQISKISGKTNENGINYDVPKSKYRLHSEHEHNSDSNEPQQTFYGSPFYGNGGYGRESITAIATSGAGPSAAAQVGLVTMASLLGALALL